MGCICIKKKQEDQKQSVQKQQQRNNQATLKFDMKKVISHCLNLQIKASTFIKVNHLEIDEKYEILEVLGRGSFAVVFKARQKATQQIRAIKQIKKGLVVSVSSQARKEFEVLRQLSHPNIIRTYELIDSQNFLYIVSEYCDGGELYSTLLQQRRFNEEKAAQILNQLLSAVAYSHNQKVIHRDIKPENILMHKSQIDQLNVSLADFGNASFFNRNQSLKGLFGSCYYIAPEMFHSDYDEKVDIWSIGIIMYVMLTGKAPYSGRNERVILQQAEHSPFQPDKGQCYMTEAAFQLMQSMLKIDSRERISALQALQHPWFQMVAKENPLDISDSLSNIRDFYCNIKLKEAVQIYITTQLLDKEELDQMKQVFITIDRNRDGYITIQELTQVISQYTPEWQKEAEEIMRKCDADNSGMIDYTEFLTACANWEALLCEKYLEEAFRVFDIDSSGTITADEIRQVLEGDQKADDKVWLQILAEVDSNNDGVISLQEFLEIMSRNLG